MAAPATTDIPDTKSTRPGGFLLVLVCAAAGYTIAGLLALHSVPITAAFTSMSTEQILQVNEVPTRLALVVAVAGLIGLAGVTLDVLHTGVSPARDLWVRALALTAGATAVVGAWGALPGPLLEASTFWAFVVLGGGAALFALVVSMFRFWRLSNRKPEPTAE